VFIPCRILTTHSIQLNLNYAAALQIDSNNRGHSFIIGLGDYTGGKLFVQDEVLDIRHSFVGFNGLLPHMTVEIPGILNARAYLNIYNLYCVSKVYGTHMPLLLPSFRGVTFPATGPERDFKWNDRWSAVVRHS
jgi:hypothetical protein